MHTFKHPNNGRQKVNNDRQQGSYATTDSAPSVECRTFSVGRLECVWEWTTGTCGVGNSILTGQLEEIGIGGVDQKFKPCQPSAVFMRQ